MKITLSCTGHSGILLVGKLFELNYRPDQLQVYIPFNDWDDVQVDRFIRAMYYPPYTPAMYKGIPVTTFEEYMKLRVEKIEH